MSDQHTSVDAPTIDKYRSTIEDCRVEIAGLQARVATMCRAVANHPRNNFLLESISEYAEYARRGLAAQLAELERFESDLATSQAGRVKTPLENARMGVLNRADAIAIYEASLHRWQERVSQKR